MMGDWSKKPLLIASNANLHQRRKATAIFASRLEGTSKWNFDVIRRTPLEIGFVVQRRAYTFC